MVDLLSGLLEPMLWCVFPALRVSSVGVTGKSIHTLHTVDLFQGQANRLVRTLVHELPDFIPKQRTMQSASPKTKHPHMHPVNTKPNSQKHPTPVSPQPPPPHLPPPPLLNKLSKLQTTPIHHLQPPSTPRTRLWLWLLARVDVAPDTFVMAIRRTTRRTMGRVVGVAAFAADPVVLVPLLVRVLELASLRDCIWGWGVGAYQEPGMGPVCGAVRGADMEICMPGSWECEGHCCVLSGGEVVMFPIRDMEVRLLIGLIILGRR
jgi:hypothetical protein